MFSLLAGVSSRHGRYLEVILARNKLLVGGVEMQMVFMTYSKIFLCSLVIKAHSARQSRRQHAILADVLLLQQIHCKSMK